MNRLLQKTALELADLLRTEQLTSVDLTQACLDRIAAVDSRVHAFLLVDAEGALAQAQEVDRRRAAGEDLHPLAGIPIALKDNIVTAGLETTCASKILEGWIPPYDATVVVKLREAGLPIVGKTNLDEFAMGSSTEFSAYGATHNPWNLDLIPGGSGGGSAAAVSAYMVPLALGSDTGGSIRQPAAFTGTVGVKPTYGGVSRYGLGALASSLDQIGPVARTVADAAALQDLISGHDPKDSTSLPGTAANLSAAVKAAKVGSVAGLRVGIVKEQVNNDGFEPEVVRAFETTIEYLRQAGAEIVEVDCPSFEYALAAYYLIMAAEASSNLARYDGIRYGIRVEPADGPVTAERMMAATRAAGFGDEVKRRIILGTYVLSAGYYESFYGNAQKVRTLVQRDLQRVFANVDVLVSPVTPMPAFPLGDKVGDPLAMYLIDIATIPANMAGTPAMSVPMAVTDAGLPLGFQIMAPIQGDEIMYRVGQLVADLVTDVAGNCPAKDWEGN